jgi:PPOX class probable FMN-dependent enzyme
MASDPHRIESVEQLREAISAPDPIMHAIKGDRVGERELDYLQRSPFLLLATCDADGKLDVSPKGDAAGFVLLEESDDGTQSIVIPDRPGNHLAYGHLNIISSGRAGVIFMIPGTPETLRINGSAELTRDPELLERLAARGRTAIVATRIQVEECFFHCAKAFLRSELWKPETWPERVKISFGEMMAEKLSKTGPNDELAQMIDKEIEQDYATNL